MTEHESSAATTGPRALRLRRRHREPAVTPALDRAQPRADESLISRVTACALGLAFAEREDADGLRELVGIAEAQEPVLAAARERISEVGVVDEATRARADALLYTAIGHLDRLVG
jgi:hypothetical protein